MKENQKKKYDFHKKSYLPEYRVYQVAKQRCTNPNSQRWYTHGARGIKFLFKSFTEFMTAIGPRLSSDYSLDRWPNNDGNYETGNVRWATRSEQQKNKRAFTWSKTARSNNGKGYYWHKASGKWLARIKYFGKNIYLGLYTSQREASKAYKKALQELSI